jgi:hypothetical protein
MKLLAAGFILAPSLAMADSSALDALKATAGSDATAQAVNALPAVPSATSDGATNAVVGTNSCAAYCVSIEPFKNQEDGGTIDLKISVISPADNKPLMTAGPSSADAYSQLIDQCGDIYAKLKGQSGVFGTNYGLIKNIVFGNDSTVLNDPRQDQTGQFANPTMNEVCSD